MALFVDHAVPEVMYALYFEALCIILLWFQWIHGAYVDDCPVLFLSPIWHGL
jgi:hypothetical protein